MLNDNDNTVVAELQPATELIVADGAHWDEGIQEWVIVLNGEPAAWTTEGQGRAWDIYNDFLRVAKDHVQRAIPAFVGDDLAFVVYPDTCPDCKREYGKCSCPEIPFGSETWPIPAPITEADQYGIEAAF